MSGLLGRTARCRFLLFIAISSFVSVSYGQRKSDEELKIPDPESVTVQAKDGVPIRCSYYPGGFIESPGEEKDKPKVEKKSGKEVVPVIMLHGWEGRRHDFDQLASLLQRQGHAVIVPDLRGHGDSKTVTLANGGVKEINLDRMRSNDIAGMLLDVEATKKFLMKENNAGNLNIELLTVVGADVGAIVAVNWAAYDWSRRQLPAFKQGRDVKALVLISPKSSHKGYSLTKSLNHPIIKQSISLMLIVGEDDRTSARDAKQIHTRLEKMRNDPPKDPKERDLFYLKAKAALQGTELLNVPGLPLRGNIALFINWRLVRRAGNFTWSARKNPLSGS